MISRHPPPAYRSLSRLSALRAHCASWRLDHELAAGADPASSRLLTARAAELTAPRLRGEAAQGLEEIADGAARPSRPRDAIWTVDRRTARAAAPRLRALAERLDGNEPVGARGIALIRSLLIDGSGPLHTGDDVGLDAALSEIDTALTLVD